MLSARQSSWSTDFRKVCSELDTSSHMPVETVASPTCLEVAFHDVWGMSPKKHHYVPETYLKGFSDAAGFLHVGRKDAPDRLIPLKPDNVGFKKYYYSQYDDAGVRDDRMEELFGQIENGWSALRSKIANWQKLSPKDCEELWLFIGAQRARVPAARDMMESLLAHRSKADLMKLVGSNQIPPPPKELEGRLNELVVSIDPRKSIEGMPHLLRAVTKTFGKIGLRIFHNETGVPFLTSDNPVCIFDPTLRSKDLKPYVLTPGGPIELLFPIDSFTLIGGRTDWRSDFAKRGPRHFKLRDKEVVLSTNRLIARFAYEVLMGSCNNYLSLLKAYSGTSPVLQNVAGWSNKSADGVPTMGFGPRPQKPKWKG